MPGATPCAPVGCPSFTVGRTRTNPVDEVRGRSKEGVEGLRHKECAHGPIEVCGDGCLHWAERPETAVEEGKEGEGARQMSQRRAERRRGQMTERPTKHTHMPPPTDARQQGC